MSQFVLMGDEFVPADAAVVNVRSHAFNYGTSVFEGIRAYWNEEEEELLIFRLGDHLERLRRSAALLHMALPDNTAGLVDRCRELLSRNAYREDAYLRPIAYKGMASKLGTNLTFAPDEFTAYSFPQGEYLSQSRALRVCVSSWRRISDNAAPARGKIGGTYVNSALAVTDATLQGFDECIMLTDDGSVAEGSTSNLFLVQGNSLITPPVTADILVGITRATVIQIAQEDLGMEVVERTVDRSELYGVDEAFLCGTGAELSGIGSIDNRTIGTGEFGAVTQELQKRYSDAVHGRVEKYRNWCTPVYNPDPSASVSEAAVDAVEFGRITVQTPPWV